LSFSRVNSVFERQSHNYLYNNAFKSFQKIDSLDENSFVKARICQFANSSTTMKVVVFLAKDHKPDQSIYFENKNMVTNTGTKLPLLPFDVTPEQLKTYLTFS